MSALKARIKEILFGILGKDPEAVVVSFLSGRGELARAMVEEIRRLVPDREHFTVTLDNMVEARRMLRRKRIALAPVLFTREPEYAPLRRLAFRMAPGRVLAYNERLERHHLRLRTLIASWLFVRGVPLDRIFLRPRWLVPWRRDRSVVPDAFVEHAGRALSAARRRVAVLTPYAPYPLSHGGAVRMYNLLREASRRFDVYLVLFSDPLAQEQIEELGNICAKLYVSPRPRYREPRWSTLRPPEVKEFRAPAVDRLLEDLRAQQGVELVQVEYTQLATYRGDVLVEHDVTFDLYRQIYERQRTRGAWWDWWRWQRFERRAVQRFRSVVVMSDKDKGLLGLADAAVVPNGVDLERFRAEPDTGRSRVLFVGSFSHFPNIVAYRFFTEEVWPRVLAVQPQAELVVVAGPNAELHWERHTGLTEIPAVDGVTLYGFVADVRPLYADAGLVVVPTRVSAGTNLKVLEAMAVERAVVSTTSGCAGIALEHGKSVWIADDAPAFAEGVLTLMSDVSLRMRIAREAKQVAIERYGWDRIGEAQAELWDSLLPRLELRLRRGNASDLGRVKEIEAAGIESAHWEPQTYLDHDFVVACLGSTVAGFMVTRRTTQREREILNIAVAQEFRRMGVATALIKSLDAGEIFLEVRESNLPAQALYQRLGFEVVGRRPGYYENPPEAAMVMRRVR